ncbi:MAG: phosphatase PAP2 family protein [Bacteroidota bacterium]
MQYFFPYIHTSAPRLWRGVFCWIWVIGFCGQSLAQGPQRSPYPWQAKQDLPILTGIGLTLGSSLWLSRAVEPLTPAELGALDRNQVLRFDRGIIGQWWPGAAKVSDVLLLGSLALPFGLNLFGEVRPHWKEHLLMTQEVLFLTYGLTNLAKVLTLRPRPFTYLNDPAVEELQMGADARYSFFSGHTSMSAAGCWYSATVFQQLYPDSPARHWVWAGAALIPAATGYLRVRSNKHFPTDVLVGYVIGAAVGTLIPRLKFRK